MNIALRLFVLGLTAYSAVLLLVEWQTSQEFVRHYFSDIEKGRPFFAINTTLSAFLLLGAAILLVFAASSGVAETVKGAKLFAWSQAAMLSLLAFDDRFQLHEALAYRLEIADHFLMLTWAGIELILLAVLSRPMAVPMKAVGHFSAGVCLFVLMMVFDALVPHDMIMRLSIEDLAKSWAAAMFFASAWFFARFQLGLDPDVRTLDQFLAGIAWRGGQLHSRKHF